MEAKHRAGQFPLKIETDPAVQAIIITTNQGNFYAKTYDPSAARLIASAPEVLEALKEAQSYICRLKKSIKDLDHFHIQAVMASARSKAEGRA